MKRIITKTTYLHIFTAIVVVLALYRCVAMPLDSNGKGDVNETHNDSIVSAESKLSASVETNALSQGSVKQNLKPVQTPHTWHRILSVPNYKVAFPDSNEVQLAVENKYGVKPVQNRMDA